MRLSLRASKKMMLPILYTVLTTICAFLSLVFSGIKPIIDFGWMMTLGLVVSLLITFLLLPSLLSLLSSDNELNLKETDNSVITSLLGSFTKNNEILIYGTTLIIVAFSIVGILKLEVENSFINYFDKDTEIYKGMKKIDEELGGTTPLNIILKFPLKEKKLSLMMNLMNGKKIVTIRRIKLNIGLQEIKWIRF